MEKIKTKQVAINIEIFEGELKKKMSNQRLF
jgi:hypothetical protein